MASAKKSTSNRVKPVSSAAKVRMADTKATKAAAAKAPRYPRGQQGWGMNTSKGSVSVVNSYAGTDDDNRGGRMSTGVYAEASGKKAANSLVKTAMNSKAAGLKGMGKKKLVVKQNDSGDFGSYNSKPTTVRYREYESKKQPKVTVKKKSK
jgi:hypothetical protein